MLIPSLIGRHCSEAERDLLPVDMGGLELINPSDSTNEEYSASIRVSAPLVSKIEAQSHETPEEAEVQHLVYATRKEKDDGLREELEEVKAMLLDKTQRGSTLISIRQTGVDTLMIRTQSRVRVRVRVWVMVRVRVRVIYLNQTGIRHQIVGGVGVRVMHSRSDAPSSNPTHSILK